MPSSPHGWRGSKAAAQRGCDEAEIFQTLADYESISLGIDADDCGWKNTKFGNSAVPFKQPLNFN